ncbi:MAG: peroxiredoxin [Acidocella sp.]|nr:peroxiredoxin [Acidocella sp.]
MIDIVSKSFQKPLRMGDKAPAFRARTTQGEIRLDQFLGRWLIFFSHPADFTPVCTSEFVALANAADEFAARDCALVGLSVDSLFAHIGWMHAIREAFGLVIPFPIVEDPSMAVARAYGMLDEDAQDSSAVRAAYFIDPAGIIRAITWYPMNVGRSVAEMLRLVCALQQVEATGLLTPEGWQPGDPFLLPPSSGAETMSAGAPPDWFCRQSALS